VPLAHDVDCAIVQPVASATPSAEDVLVGEKVPAAQGVQTRSDTADAALE
jgi:hypothetical protein